MTFGCSPMVPMSRILAFVLPETLASGAANSPPIVAWATRTFPIDVSSDHVLAISDC